MFVDVMFLVCVVTFHTNHRFDVVGLQKLDVFEKLEQKQQVTLLLLPSATLF